MRILRYTLLPLLIVAALIVWGGERFARRESSTRVPADRERLLDFSGGLGEELQRLDTLYETHLMRVTEGVLSSPKTAQEECDRVVAVRECSVFFNKERREPIRARSTGIGEKLPELAIEGGKRPFNPDHAVILPAMYEGQPSSGWIRALDSRYHVYWRRFSNERIVALTVNDGEWLNHTRNHLNAWMKSFFAPLREAGELVAVSDPSGEDFVTTSTERRGPAALVVPFRTNFGEWEVRSWDRIHVSHYHDAPSLIYTGLAAVVLLLLGLFLFIQQTRAIRLAEERVTFVNRVSHELGTPLTNILLNLDLATEALSQRPAESERRLRLIGEEVRRLARLVSNVLTFSRGERKTLQLQSRACVPDEVIEQMLSQFLPSLERRGFAVEWQKGAHERVVLDPDALAQITGNLLSNVEKYAATGGWVALESHWEHERLRVRVSDRGPGIPVHLQSRIFQPFERVGQNLDEGSSGTGLGLSIARDLARRMGGDLLLLPATQGAVFECEMAAPAHLSLIEPSSAA